MTTMTTPTLTPSSYQSAIYTWVTAGAGSLVVEAVAGSGKTSTLLHLLSLIPRSQSVRLFAFNRDIAQTLQSRISQPNVDASTYHSAGYRAILKHLGTKVDTDKRKGKTLIAATLSDADARGYGADLLKLVGLAKHAAIGVLESNTPAAWQALIDHHDLDFQYPIPPRLSDEQFQQFLKDEQARVITLAMNLLQSSNEAAEAEFEWAIDFDDHLYLPLYWNLPLPQYDWVLIDEAQDTNRVQREFAKRSLKPGGRLIAVGDSHQAIYGWRGASHDALDLLRHDFTAQSLPLSVCYRCGHEIVRQARMIVPQIEAWEEASAGIVAIDVDPTQLSTLTLHDAILCRNNAPLVKHAYALIKAGVGVQILGRDLGEDLQRLVERMHATSVEDLLKRLLLWRDKEVKRFATLKQPAKSAKAEDQVASIQAILESGVETIPQLLAAIGTLFGDGSKPLLTLSTIHKAKGKEWDTVAIIGRWLIPSFYATKPWQQQQEQNLLYVAYTRAKRRLWIVDDKPEWMKKKEARLREEEEGA